MNHRIEITLSARKYAATYRGEHIGDFKSPETEAARWLLANGHAASDDTLTICRNGSPAMIGGVGWLADHTVEENEKVSPRWRKFRPFGLKPSDGAQTLCGSAAGGQDSILGVRLPPEAIAGSGAL
jgi:hypothetical protein